MRFMEYGMTNDKTILLLHGGGLSWWNYKEAAEFLQHDYHVILPVLHGHGENNKSFSTIEDNAADIISFIDKHCGGHVLLIGGLSLGAQIALEICSQRKDICQYALIESASVIPSRWLHSMIKPAFGSCYGLIKYKWFSRLQFKSLKIKAGYFNLYYQDTCSISKQDMIAFLQANTMYCLKESIKECNAKVHVFAGKKENRTILQSAKLIHNTLPECRLEIIPKYYHGEFSINHGKDYAAEIREIVKRS